MEKEFKLHIFDCVTGYLRVSSDAFMTMGSNEHSTFHMHMSCQKAGTFARRGKHCSFFPSEYLESYSINGAAQNQVSTLTPGEMYLFVMAGACFLCYFGEEATAPDFNTFSPESWFVYRVGKNEWSGPYELSALNKIPDADEHALASFSGLNDRAFFLSDMQSVAGFLENYPELRLEISKNSAPSESICPFCWETIRYINEDGEDIRQAGSKFSCCHCEHKLPEHYQETVPCILSIAGAPGAGKSCYTSELMREAERVLTSEFGVVFRDANKTASHLQHKEDDNCSNRYHRVLKNGKKRLLPVPFTYTLSRKEKHVSLVTYDNAGENYLPGDREKSNFSTRHLAAASAIFFIIDPTVDPEFQRILGTAPNETTTAKGALRQSSILAEIESRLRSELSLPLAIPLDVPLAVILTKSDQWFYPLLGGEPLLPVHREGKLINAHVDENSRRICNVIRYICPELVMQAEAAFSRVHFFATTSYDFVGANAAQPRERHLTDPLLWALSMKHRAIIPAIDHII